MKKSILLLLILAALAAVLSFSVSASPVSAAEEPSLTEEEAREELLKNIEELLNSLDTDAFEDYLSSLGEWEGGSLKETLYSLISGDGKLDYASLADGVISLVWEEASALLPAFAVILAAALICGILNSAKIDILHSSMSDIITFVGYLAVGGAVLGSFITAVSGAFSAMQGMKRQMDLIYPLLLTLMAASGGTVSAAVYQPAVAFLSSGLSGLFLSVVFPAAVLMLVLSLAGNLSDEIRTEKLSALFESVIKWLIGLSCGLFGLFLSVQGLTAAQYDGISLRAAKYALSSSVPIVGSFLSGGVDLVLAGSALIKNALGSFAVFLLAATALKPLLLLAAFQLFLRFSAAATEPVGGKIPHFLSKAAGCMGYFIAGFLCIAFLYFLTLVLLICSSGVIVT